MSETPQKTVLLRHQGMGEYQPVLIESGKETEEGELFRPKYSPADQIPNPESDLLGEAVKYARERWGMEVRFLIGNTLRQAIKYNPRLV